MVIMNHEENRFPPIDDEDWILDKPISVLALDPADRRVLKVADQRDAVQKKTFTKWMNFYLSTRDGLHVEDLYQDLRDGNLLLSLLEIFTHQSMPRERGVSKFHALRNLERCLQCLEENHHIRLVNIRPEELLNGNSKLTLGLIWRIILHFQFSEISLPAYLNSDETGSIPESKSRSPFRKSNNDQIPSNYRQKILIWARQQCEYYPGILIEDFTYSWRNGRAFLAILHRHNPQLIDIKQMYRCSNRENLLHAFQFAQKHYGITQLIDPEDVDTDEPDEKIVLLYISHLYKVCPTIPEHPFHDQIRFESDLSNEYTNLTTDLLKWIKSKMNFLHREITFHHLEEYHTFESLLQMMKNEELETYQRVLDRIHCIDTEFQTLQIDDILQPDRESIDSAWNQLEKTIDRMEKNIDHWKRLQTEFDSIEQDLQLIIGDSSSASNQSDHLLMNEIQIKLEDISTHCQTLSLSDSQTHLFLDKLNQIHQRINTHVTSLSNITNGIHQSQIYPSPPTTSLDEETFDMRQLTDKEIIKELNQIKSNLHTLHQFFQEQLSQIPTSDVDLLILHKQHKEFENQLLSQASRVQNIRNYVRQEFNSSSHQELRSLVNQTSNYVQHLFTNSKNYSDRLQLADRALNLLNHLTNELIEFETRLLSDHLHFDDENVIHRQLNDLIHRSEIFEKSINELLTLSQQLNNERLIHTSEQLAHRWKYIPSEIQQRKRLISQIIESHRSFKTLFDQEERILHHLEKRFQTLEPLSSHPDRLRSSTKHVTDLFHELLARAQSIEHINNVAVKLIEQIKVHEKNLQTYPSFIGEKNSRSTFTQSWKIILNKIEAFDQHYANVLSNLEEYIRYFLKTCNLTGQIINLPLHSALTIVQHYRRSIVSRYNLTFDDDQSVGSAHIQKNSTGQCDSSIIEGFIDLTDGKVTADRPNHYPLLSSDGSISLETTYVIPIREISNEFDNDLSKTKKVRFIIQQGNHSGMTNGTVNVTSTKSSNEMTQRKNLSFIDAVNSKYLDLSTGLFSSPSLFARSSSYSYSSPFSSSTSPPDQHRLSHNHFSSSPPHTTNTTTTIPNNKNLLSTSSLSVNNHPPLVGADLATTPTNTTTNITLKEAIDANILDARSAYVVDTLEQRHYDLRTAYSLGLINSTNHQIIDRIRSQQLTLAEAFKMGILKVGDSQSYNVISKTESLIISSVFDHRTNTFIDPNVAIRNNILDPYHGLYLNNLTHETISIDDAMSKGFVIVEQQIPTNAHPQHHDKYVISTSLIRETRSFHLLGVRDYLNNKELSVQDAIRAGILDKQNGQYINRKTNEIFSISEAIAQGHIRAQPLPVETTTSEDNAHLKRGTVKETKTYTLKSAIHPKTRQEIPIRAAIDEGIIDHARGFYVNSLTGENLPISVAIEKGLIFTELIDLHSRRFVKTLIIEQVIDPVTNRRLGVTEAIKTGLLNSTITVYYHSVTQKQMTILEAYEQGLIIGKFRDSHPSTFYGDQREQVFYLITGVTDIRTDKIYTLQEGIQQKLFDHKKGVYIHPITMDEINIGDAVKRGFIQVQAVSSQIAFNNQTEQMSSDQRRTIISQEPYGNNNDSRSKLSIRIESQGRTRTPYEVNESTSLQREKDVVEIESIQRVPRSRKEYTREEEIIEHRTTNVAGRDVFINRNGINRTKSNERPRQEYIEEVVIDDGINNNRRAKFDIKEDRHTSHREIVIEGDKYVPPPVEGHVIIHDTHREHKVTVVPAVRPQPAQPPPRPVHINDHQREGRRIDHGELIIDDHPSSYPSSSTNQTTVRREYIDITDTHSKPQQHHQTSDYQFDEHQSLTEEEWEQWHCILMIKDQPYRVVWVLNTATGDRLPLQVAYQRGLVDTKERLFFDEKLNRQSYSFEKAVELGYMGIEPDAASLPIHVDGIDYMIHWVLDASIKRRIFPRPAVRKQILDATHGRYVNPYNNSQVSLHEAIYLKFIGATEYNATNDYITVNINGQIYNIKWVYDTRNMKKILPRDALKQGVLDIQLNEYRKFDTNDVMTIYDAIQAGYIRCNDDDSSSDNSVRPPSIISVDEDELTIATKTATYVITTVIHPLTQKEIKVSEAIDLGILDKDIGSYKDLVTNVQYELAEAINEGLVYATIIETKEDTEMLTSSVQEIIKKFLVKSVAVDSESQEKISGLEAQAIGILNYAQGVYHDRKHGTRIPLDKAIEKNLLEVELISQKRFEEYDLELITDTITEKRITLYRIHGVRNNVLDRMESGAVAVKSQLIDTETKTYTDFSTGETMSIQEAINKNLIQAEISEHVERKPLGLSMQNAIRLGFYVAETGTFRDPATEHYMTLMEAIERGHIHVNGIAFADSEQGPITLYDAFSLGLINRRDGGKLNPAKMGLYRARLVESKLHRMNVEDAIRCGLLNLRTGLYKHPHSGEQLNLKEAIQRGLIDGQSTIIEHPTSGRFLTLKDALDGIRIDNEGQVIDSYSNKVITTLELAFNHRKLFSQFDVNAGEVFLPNQNESVGFEKAIRKNLLDNNRMKLFDPKTSREYTVQDAIERGLVDQESGLIYDTHSHTQYSVREAIRHGIVAIVGAPLVPIKADHETVAAKITSRKNRRHSLAKSSLHFDYNSAPESADEDSHGSGGGWHRIKSRARATSPLSMDGASDFRRNLRRRTGSSPSRTHRDDDWKKSWRSGTNEDDETFAPGGNKRFGETSFYSSVTSRIPDNQMQGGGGGQTSSTYQQRQEIISTISRDIPKDEDTVEQLLIDIKTSTNDLISFHHRLNSYIYLTDDLEELQKNLQKFHFEGEEQRLSIRNLLERATRINSHLAIVCTDLDEKRIEIFDVSEKFNAIINRFVIALEEFHTNSSSLNQWIEENTRELDKEWQLSTLVNDNERLKRIFNTGMALQTDLNTLENIHSLIDNFPAKTNNNINHRQEIQILSQNYTRFLHQCEYHIEFFDKLIEINSTFVQSTHSKSIDQLDTLLLLTQKQLNQLIPPLSIESPISITNHHLTTLLHEHSQHYEQIMHHLKFFQRIEYERQIIKERIREFHQWLLTEIDQHWTEKILSLKQSKLNEQIDEFHRFEIVFQTREHSFHTDLNSPINHEQLFDEDDQHLLKFIDEHLSILSKQIHQCQQRFTHLSTSLTNFHEEHAAFIDTYSKYFRLYTEEIQENFSTLESILKEDIFDHRRYEQLLDDLLNQSNIEDENELIELDHQAREYRIQYQIFYNDLKILLQHRQEFLQAKQSIEKAKTLFTINENLLLPFDLPSIENLLTKYQEIFNQLKSMSPTIDAYKNIYAKFFDNDSSDIEKIWSDMNEYILDTLDYLQLHQEDLREFYQLAEKCEQADEDEFIQQMELVERKGQLLLQTSPIHSESNPIEHLLEMLHRKSENFTRNSFEDQLDELDGMMNDLSDLIVSSTTDPISSKPMKLAEQILDNTVVKNELEKWRMSFEEVRMKNLHHQPLEKRLELLNEHWLIMKQANENHRENLLRTQTSAKQFWKEYQQSFSNDNHEHFRQCALELLTLIGDNPIETQEIQSLVEQRLKDFDKDHRSSESLDELCQSFSKILIYETPLRQNRIDNIPADINQSLDICTLKLTNLSNDLPMDDSKQLEITLGKFRDLVNEIELICYDIEQLKQSDDPREREFIQPINQRWEELLKQTNEKYHYLENQFEQMKIQVKYLEECSMELKLIDQQIQQCTNHVNLTRLIERLEQLPEHSNEYLIDVKQRALHKGEELIRISESIESFQQSQGQFREYLSECERYLNTQKPIERHFRLYQRLLKQIDEHQSFENQCQIYGEYLIDLDRSMFHLNSLLPKKETLQLQTSLVSIRKRWQKILTRSHQRRRDLKKMMEKISSMMKPMETDIDQIKDELHRQTSLCQCSKKYHVQQIAEGRYRFGHSQSLRLVRILRSAVMVRVGGGWTGLDEFLLRHDPCREVGGMKAKGRTNYELYPENYALRDGVAQTMTSFKPKLLSIRRPTCQHQSCLPTPIRSVKDNSRPNSSTQPSNGDSSISGDDLSISPRVGYLDDSEMKQSRLSVPYAMFTPATSILSRTSSRESVISEHSFLSPSPPQQSVRRASKLPLPIGRLKTSINIIPPVNHS